MTYPGVVREHLVSLGDRLLWALENLYIEGGSVREALRFAFGFISIFVDNGLDETVTVQFKANRQNNTTKAVDMGATFQVAGAGSDARSLSHETSAWLPYLYLEVSCSVAPTAGALNIYLIRGSDEQYLVEALEIRDMATHDPDSDAEITIKPW